MCIGLYFDYKSYSTKIEELWTFLNIVIYKILHNQLVLLTAITREWFNGKDHWRGPQMQLILHSEIHFNEDIRSTILLR